MSHDETQEGTNRVEWEQLARDLETGYRAEADQSSLDPEWESVETEGL